MAAFLCIEEQPLFPSCFQYALALNRTNKSSWRDPDWLADPLEATFDVPSHSRYFNTKQSPYFQSFLRWQIQKLETLGILLDNVLHVDEEWRAEANVYIQACSPPHLKENNGLTGTHPDLRTWKMSPGEDGLPKCWIFSFALLPIFDAVVGLLQDQDGGPGTLELPHTQCTFELWDAVITGTTPQESDVVAVQIIAERMKAILPSATCYFPNKQFGHALMYALLMVKLIPKELRPSSIRLCLKTLFEGFARKRMSRAPPPTLVPAPVVAYIAVRHSQHSPWVDHVSIVKFHAEKTIRALKTRITNFNIPQSTFNTLDPEAQNIFGVIMESGFQETKLQCIELLKEESFSGIFPIIQKPYYISLYYAITKALRLEPDKKIIFRFYDLFSRVLYPFLPNNLNHDLKIAGVHLAPSYPLLTTFDSPITDFPKPLVIAKFLKKLLHSEDRDNVTLEQRQVVDQQTYIFDLLETAIRKNRNGTMKEYLDYIRAFVPLGDDSIGLIAKAVKFLTIQRQRKQLPLPQEAPFCTWSMDMFIELFRQCDRDTIYSCSRACKYFFAFLHNQLCMFWRPFHSTSPLLLKRYEPFLKYFTMPKSLLF